MTLHIPTAPACQRCSDNGILREALRLRVRWVQELSGRAAWELGERLAAAGDLTEPELIRHMTLEHVEAVATKRAVVVPALVASHHHDFGAPLPAWFQLSDLGKPIRGAVRRRGRRRHRRRRRFGQRPGHATTPTIRPTGSVLVTTTLSPGLGPLLPRLQGHRVRDRLGAVPPRHPGPRGRGADGRRLRRAPPTTCPKAPSSTSTATPDGSPSRARSRRREDHRLARRHRHAAGGRRLHGRLAEPLGVEPGAVLRADRPHRRGRLWRPGSCCGAWPASSTTSRRRRRPGGRPDPQRDPAVAATASPGCASRRDSSTCSSPSWSAGACSSRGSPGSSIASRRRRRRPPARSAWLASSYPISYPSGGLLLDDVTVLAQEVPGADDAQIRQLLRRGGRP